MHSRSLQLLKRHRHALPWLVVKKSLAGVVTFETLVLFECELSAWMAPAHCAPPGLTVQRIDAGSSLFERLCAKYQEKDFRERAGLPGRECYVALRDGDIAGYAWVSDDSMHVDEIACVVPIAADEVFIYDCFVDAAHRGAGIYPAMLCAALTGCATRQGIRRAVIGAASINQASVRGIRKAGFREWKRIHYLQCGNLQRWWGLDPETTRASAI